MYRELGCADAPGTYGVADLGGRTRIVWRYTADNETRTFEVRYTLRGLKANVASEIKKRRWFFSHGLVPLVLALLAFAGLGAVMFFLAAGGWRPVYPRGNLGSGATSIAIGDLASGFGSALAPSSSGSGGSGGVSPAVVEAAVEAAEAALVGSGKGDPVRGRPFRRGPLRPHEGAEANWAILCSLRPVDTPSIDNREDARDSLR